MLGTRWRALPPVEEEDTLVDSHGAWTLQPAKCLMAFLHQGVPIWGFRLWASTCAFLNAAAIYAWELALVLLLFFNFF